MRTRELARLISTLGKLPREQRYAVATEVASMQSRASSIDVIEAEAPARPECRRVKISIRPVSQRKMGLN